VGERERMDLIGVRVFRLIVVFIVCSDATGRTECLRLPRREGIIGGCDKREKGVGTGG
jgi:hypothetical protein